MKNQNRFLASITANRLFSRSRLLILSAACAIAMPAVSKAANDTWVGGGANGRWSLTGNWSGGAPASGGSTNLIFAGTVRLSATNNGQVSEINSITFNFGAGAFTLSGSALQIDAGGITNNSTNTQTLSFGGNGIALGKPEIWNAASGNILVTSKVNINGNGVDIIGSNNVTISGNISGSGGGALFLPISVGKADGTPGSLTLSGNNTFGTDEYGDGVQLESGTLTVDSNTALSTGVLIIQNSGTTGVTLASGTTGIKISNEVDAGTSFSVAPTGTLELSGSVVLIAGITNTIAITSLNNGTLKFSGGISQNGGTMGLTLDGGGVGSQFTFSGSVADTYTGLTTVTDGATLTLSMSGSDSAIEGNLQIDNGSTVKLNQANQIANSATVTVNGTFNMNGNSETINDLEGTTGSVKMNGATLTVSQGNYSGVLQNNGSPGSLVMDGTGTLTLSGNSNYSGGTTLNEGTLIANNNNALGSGTLVINNTGTGVTLGSGTTGINLGNTLDVQTSFSVAPSTAVASGTLTVSGPIILDTTSGTTSFTITATNGNVFRMIGGINQSGSVAASIVYDGGGSAVDGIFRVGDTSASSTYTGLTTVTDDATLILNNTGASVAIPGNLQIDNGSTVKLAANNEQISNSATVTVDGSFVLNGRTETINDLEGASTGVVQIGTGTFIVSTGSYSGIIKGASGGAFVMNGPGTLALYGNSTYSAETEVNGGVLQAGATDVLSQNSDFVLSSTGTLDLNGFDNNIGSLASGTAGGGIVTNNGTMGATLTVGNDNNSTAFAGVIEDGSSPVRLTKAGAGTLTLTGTDNTYSGRTRVNQGTLLAGVTDAFSPNSNVTVKGGVLDIGGFNNVIGALDDGGVNTGIVQNSGSTAATLSVGNTNGSGTFSGVIQDSGAALQLTKIGTGTETFTGTNTYTGPTNINAGALIENGSTDTSAVNVSSGAFFGGNAILLKGNLMNAGIVSPGNSPGTISVAGNYNQQSTGSLVIQVGGAGAGQYDLLSVGGSATLSGTLQIVRLNNFQLTKGEKVVFLTAANGVSGQFSTVQNSFTAGAGTIMQTAVVYEADDVALELLFQSYAGLPGLTPNQYAVGRALDGVAGNAGFANLFNFLDNESIGNLPHDYDLISPEQLTSIFNISFSFADVQAGNIEARLAEIRAENTSSTNLGVSVHDGETTAGYSKDDDKKTISTPSPETPRWNLFMEGNGEFVHVDGDTNAAGYNFTTGGVTVGADYHVCDHFTIGIMGGYADTGATLTQGGAVDVNSGRLGIYSTTYGNGFYLNTMAAGGYNSYDTHRTGLGGIAQGDTDGEEFDGLISTGYDFHSGNFTVGPIASAQYTYVSINNFTENGSLAPLNIPSQNQDSFRSKVGFKVSSLWHVGGIVVTPTVSAAWQHEYLDSNYALDSSFASGAGNIFTVNGPALGRDSVVVNAGVNVQWTPRLGTYLYYDGELGRKNYELNSVSGGVKVNF